jgi:hypothetical protein
MRKLDRWRFGVADVFGLPDPARAMKKPMTATKRLDNPPIGGDVRQSPWKALGMSRASWYRHGNRAQRQRLFFDQ